MKAILLVSHGSHSVKTKHEVESLIKILKSKSNIPIIEYAFLEIESPNIPDGLLRCVDLGAKEIVVLLNFLNSGKHVDEDIPKIVNTARQTYPDVRILITEPVGQHPKIVNLFLDIVE